MLPVISKSVGVIMTNLGERLPEIVEKTSHISKSNTQTTLSLMTLTMMTGKSPHRQLRQVLAEIESRRMALAEAQVSHAKLLVKEIDTSLPEAVKVAEERLLSFQRAHLETKVSGAVKEIATLVAAYDNLIATHGMQNWGEEEIERAEGKHHIRRGFEMLYWNLVEAGRGKESTIEYLQQFGVHVQVALREVMGYTAHVEELITAGERPDASHLEDFLDQMAAKYEPCVGTATQRMFGVDSIVKADFMSSPEEG